MSAKRPELLIDTGAMSGRRFTVGDAGVRLGRSSSNDIVVPDEELSRNHCLFEQSGESGIRLIDLASANGTFVNGSQVDADPVELKPGDVITLGATTIRVIGENGEGLPALTAEPDDVDLGLGGSSADAKGGEPGASSAPAAHARRSPLVWGLWAFAVLIFGFAGWLLFQDPKDIVAGSASAAGGTDVQTIEQDRIVELSYEKVSADSEGIFRYQMDLLPDGTLKVSVDDVPDANRHIVKSVKLGEAALGRIREIFADPELVQLDKEYAGPTEEPPKLESWFVKVVFDRRVRTVRVVNTPEPDVFRRMRERLETFTKNELGIWAIQYSNDKLIELAEASAQTARTKWEDREVQYGNLAVAIAAWKEALFYLETVNPKPAAYETYRSSMEQAVKELDSRFSEQRFKADRAINLSDWATAAAELKILCEMIPNRDDERYREAAAKLVDVEKRQKKGAGK